jgi:hypothetical protein
MNEKWRGGFQAGYIIKGRNSSSLWPVLLIPAQRWLWPAQRDRQCQSQSLQQAHSLFVFGPLMSTNNHHGPCDFVMMGGGAEGTGSLSSICPSNRRRQGYHLLNTHPLDEVAASSTNCQHDQLCFCRWKVGRSFCLHVCLRSKKDASDDRLLQGVVVMELGFIKHSLSVWVGASLKPCCLADSIYCVAVAVAEVSYKDRLKCGKLGPLYTRSQAQCSTQIQQIGPYW